jgi:GNAT superfamily N-acetyltransferase
VNIQTSHRKQLLEAALDRYAFRVAEPIDCDAIAALAPEHWAEARYSERGIVLDQYRYRNWLKEMLEKGRGVWLLAELDDEVIGFFSYTLDHNFSEKPLAILDLFFVSKPHRRSAVPAVLLGFGLDLARHDGACAFHAPVTTEMQAARGLENMLMKTGFQPIGVILGRSL